MNKLIYFIFLFLLFGCNSKKPDYFDTNYNSVLEYAKTNNKMIFIDFYTQWCGSCYQFEKIIVNDSTFKNFIKSDFNTAKINAEIEENKEIVKKHNITGYPTFIIMKSNGEEIDRIVGLSTKNTSEFIDLINNIVSGNEQLELLKSLYYKQPDSIELYRKIIKDKYFDRNQYKEAIELSNFALQHSRREDLKNEAEFYIAYSKTRRNLNPTPKELTKYIRKENANPKFVEWGYGELYNFYCRNFNADSINYYLNILINIRKNNFYHLRRYAEFLYEQDIKIELADSLTQVYTDYGTHYADHWTPYLKAHSSARHGNKDKGIEIFDAWMKEYSKPENFKEDFWHYYFYTEFSLFYKINSENAVKYAEILEECNASISNKRSLAKLYLLHGDKDKAIKKLREVKELYEDPAKKIEIDKLIKEYEMSINKFNH